MRIVIKITCERCGESHGTIDVGPQQCAKWKTSKRIAQAVASLLSMFLRNGFEHECPRRREGA